MTLGANFPLPWPAVTGRGRRDRPSPALAGLGLTKRSTICWTWGRTSPLEAGLRPAVSSVAAVTGPRRPSPLSRAQDNGGERPPSWVAVSSRDVP